MSPATKRASESPFDGPVSSWAAVPAELQSRVEQFYGWEAHVLDERRFRDWLEFLSPDLHYWMPIRRVLPPRQRHMEFTDADELAQFDETHAELTQRVEKIETGKAWAEEPPSRTRHMVSGVRIISDGSDLDVRSSFAVYQSRSERDAHVFIGERRDRIADDSSGPLGLRVSQREIRLDHATIVAPSLSIFF